MNNIEPNNLRSSKSSLILLLVSIVLLVIVGGYLVYAQRQGQESQGSANLVVKNSQEEVNENETINQITTEPKTENQQTETRDPKRYYNDKDGYSFIVPNGWVVRTDKNYWEYFMGAETTYINRIAVVPQEETLLFENKNSDSGGEFFPNIVISVYKDEVVFNNDFWAQTINKVSNFIAPKTIKETVNKLNNLMKNSANSDYRYDPVSGFIGASERIISKNNYTFIEYQLISQTCLALIQNESGKVFEIYIARGSNGCTSFPTEEQLVLESLQTN